VARIGILTGGGDCPGLNAAIRGVIRKAVGVFGHEGVGFRNGWLGVMERETVQLDRDAVRGILHRGGTILGSSGINPMREPEGPERIRATLNDLEVDGLVAIGGEGTLGAAAQLAEQGVSVVGIPKTIDNDISGTDYTIGFRTAVQVATDAIDRLHSTAESHNRVMLVEVMGRSTGWIALYAGLAGGADVILIPEHPFDLEEVCASLRRRHMGSSSFSIVVVAEGAKPRDGTFEIPEYPVDRYGWPRMGGIVNLIAPEIERETGFETRVITLGHLQRGGTPTAYDRVLATRLGVAAADLAEAGGWGRMVALRGPNMADIPLAEAVAERKLVPEHLYRLAGVFAG
jgi:phosphofructokinase-like protein